MKKLLILFTLLFFACEKQEKVCSEELASARTQIAEGNDRAALSLLLEAENPRNDRTLRGEAACEIGRLYRRQGRTDLAWQHFVTAYSAGILDFGSFVAETAPFPTDSLQIPLSETEYAFRRQQFTGERAHLQRILRITLSATGAIALLLAGTWFFFRRRRKRETETLLALIDSLNHSASSLMSELDNRKTQEIRLRELLSNRFAEVRELTDTVYQYEHNPVLLHRKLREVLSLRATDSALFEDLEEVVDAYRNGLIRRLKAAHPALTQNELQFCALLAAGFSVQEICILLNIQSVQNVWMKKYRLRCKLQLPAGADVDAFLHDFAQVKSQESETPETGFVNQKDSNDTQSETK